MCIYLLSVVSQFLRYIILIIPCLNMLAIQKYLQMGEYQKASVLRVRNQQALGCGSQKP